MNKNSDKMNTLETINNSPLVLIEGFATRICKNENGFYFEIHNKKVHQFGYYQTKAKCESKLNKYIKELKKDYKYRIFFDFKKIN